MREHEKKGPGAVAKVPLEFFEELHREYSRILSQIYKKIEESESLAKSIF